MKIIAASLLMVCSALLVCAQEQPAVVGNLNEQRVSLNQPAVALDASGAPALEATLRTTALNGAPETPVTNVRMVVKNRSPFPLAFVSGAITFYDAAGVRCGEGMFKADALAVDESFETDSPGLRIRCEAATWRVVATNLLPRIPPNAPIAALIRTPSNFVISIDGESHPIQLDKPLVVTLGEKRRTIIVRSAQ
jgi:acid phosphatase family membrane protein YuiD